MVSAYLDAYFVACPENSNDRSEFDQYVAALLESTRVGGNALIDLYASSCAYDVLVKTGSYPLQQPIAAAIERLGIPDVQARDVVRVAHALLQRARPVEDEIGVTDWLYTELEWSSTRSLADRDPRFGQHLRQLVAVTALHQASLQNDDCRHVIVSRGESCGGQIRQLIRVEVVEGPLAAKASSWRELSVRRSIVDGPSVLPRDVSIEDLFLEAVVNADEAGIIAAIREAVYRRAPEAQWGVHAGFVTSVLRQSAVRQPGVARAVLRSIVEAVTRSAMSSTHHLRESRGADAKQVIRARDGARAWRRDIDLEYHLHYWENAGSIELSKIGSHSDMTILE